ncbi:cell division protein SepF [Saccharopolyspora sp. NPDC050389]|uniref:cell division protein SepF n=1 Tax=Saccharopolyspora sp. NPDC050389 TaxID=3155516 RepID=UPI00340DF90E
MGEANLVLSYVEVLIWPLLVIALALIAARLIARGFPRNPERPALRADVAWVRQDDATRVTTAHEDSDWLASLGGSPPPNPAVHLQQAVRVSPSTYRESARQVHESLQRGRVVILDLAGTDESTAARLIDFCSAITLASRGVLQQLSSTVLLITPHSD